MAESQRRVEELEEETRERVNYRALAKRYENLLFANNIPLEGSEVKTCTKCGAEKPLHEFNRSASHRDGRRKECKACARAYMQEWTKRNRRQGGRDGSGEVASNDG